MKNMVPTSWPKWMPRKSNGWLKSNPRIWMDWMGLPSKPRISGCGKNRIAAICANAIDASARYRPCNRSAGSAIATPKGMANSAAIAMPPMLPRSGAHCRYAKAPAPTKVIWASEICFDQPVSGTNDNMMNAVSRASVIVRMSTRPAISERATTTANRMTMPSVAIRSLGMRGRTLRIAFLPSMRACGRNSRARNSMICGMARGAVVQRPVQLRKFCWNSNTRPINKPPANVRGRLLSRPMIAAANAARISRVSVCTSRVASSSARKMPATAAIDDPSAHENIETRPGLIPLRPASSRLSTTARMATPRRVRDSSTLSPSARPRPTTIVMKRDHGISVSPIWKPDVPKKRSMCRVSCGSQISPASPMSANIRPMVVTSWATSGASAIARMSVRSINAPMSGAATNTVSSRAMNVWMPQSTRSCQKTYARNMPIAPWAKLKMPEVV